MLFSLYHRLVLIALLVILDLGSKVLILDAFKQGHLPIDVTSFFSIVYVKNYGITFGLFGETGHSWMPWVLTLFAILLTGFFIYLMAAAKWVSYRASLTLIIGGAIGNIIDRIWHGGVIDFLDFYYDSYHWPAFNMADIFISIGAGLFLWQSILDSKQKKGI